MHLTWIDYYVIAVYFAFVVAVGVVLKRGIKSSSDFLMSGRSIPLWITSLAFISANLGAQEVIGMSASGAKYGLMTAHFYWLGAIPAMVFLGVFMMPFYYGSRARSVPEYLLLRFDHKTRALNAVSFAVMTVVSSGVSLYALAILLQTLLGWSFEAAIALSAGIVMAYTYLGGLTSAIYNEVLQFFLLVLGIAPLAFIGLHHLGGWEGLKAQVPDVMVHTWKYTASSSENPMGVSWGSMAMGLGFVLSFGYWCTDFLVVQRAMVARNMSAAQRTPIIAAIPKMLVPFIVILPGLIAVALTHTGGGYSLPFKADGRIDYDLTLPTLLATYYPSGLLGVGLVALMASFMSGMAGNVTAFNAVWTYDIYQPYVRPGASDAHYLAVGRGATVFGILASVGFAYVARSFNNINDFLQLVFGFINAPLFATFLLGMFWKRATGHGAFVGLVAGTLGAAAVHGLTVAEGKGGWLAGPDAIALTSGLSQAFAISIVAWTTCFLVTIGISLRTAPRPETELRGLVYSLTTKPEEPAMPWYQRSRNLAVAVLVVAALLNIAFW